MNPDDTELSRLLKDRSIDKGRWLEALEYVLESAFRDDPSDGIPLLLEKLTSKLRETGVPIPLLVRHAVREHDPAGGRARLIRATSEIERRIKSYDPLERDGDGREGEPDARRARRTHLHLSHRPPRCMKSASTTSSAAATEIAPADHGLLPGARARPACTRAHSSKGGSTRHQLHHFRRELAARRRALFVSPSVPDAGFLAVPDGVDGARSDHVDLPGPVQPLSRAPAGS